MAMKLEPGCLPCPICTYAISADLFSSHIAVVHLNYFEFKCADCGEKLRDQEEVAKHRMMYGHGKEPTRMGMEMDYLKAVANQMSSHWTQLTDAKDPVEREGRMTGIIAVLSRAKMNSDVAETASLRDSNTAGTASDSSTPSKDSDDEDWAEETTGGKRHRRDRTDSRLSLGGQPQPTKRVRNSLGRFNSSAPSEVSEKSAEVEETPEKSTANGRRPTWTPVSPRKPLRCKLCPTTLEHFVKADLNTLCDHAWEHLAFWPFSCDQCDFSASRQEVVVDHMLAEHNILDGSVKLPSTFQWSLFDSQFYHCFRLYLPPVSDWPPDFFGRKLAEQLSQMVIPTDLCSLCRQIPTGSSSSSTTVTHLMKVNHAYAHVDKPNSCSVCGQKYIDEHSVHRHIKEIHGGKGKLVGPSEELQQRMREKFEFGFSPKFKAQLDARQAEVRHSCLQCHQELTQTLTTDDRFDHVWGRHMKNDSPYSCAECDFGVISLRGIKSHIAKRHKGNATWNPPSAALREKFMASFRKCNEWQVEMLSGSYQSIPADSGINLATFKDDSTPGPSGKSSQVDRANVEPPLTRTSSAVDVTKLSGDQTICVKIEDFGDDIHHYRNVAASINRT